MIRLAIDEMQLTAEAEAWWRFIDPSIRGVFMQAVWEIEGCPTPEEWRNRVKEASHEPAN